MPRHINDIKPYFESLSKILKQMGRDNHTPIDVSFVTWYIENKFSPLHHAGLEVSYTDQHNDGEIDAIVSLPQGKMVVVQSKYNNEYAEPDPNIKPIPDSGYDQFNDKTVPAISSMKISDFNRWLDGENIPRNSEKGIQYKTVFNAYKNNPDNVTFVLLTTYDPPTAAQKPISPDIEVLSINDVCNLERDRLEETLPQAENLVIKLLGPAGRRHQIIINDPTFDIESRIVRIKVSDLINYMQNLTDPLSVISKNVRVVLPPKGKRVSINEGILDTYENEPEQFWYSHNGISIICDIIKEKSGGKQIELFNPNIVNGAQTSMTLMKSQIDNPEATMLTRIFEVEEDDPKRKNLVFNLIMRTNSQNPITWRDLRSNEPLMKSIYNYFDDRRVFFERRRGEKNLRQSRFVRIGQRTIETDPIKLGQIIRNCESGSEGPVLAKQSGKDVMFEDYQLFKSIFKVNLNKMFFQFIIAKLVVEEIINKHPKIKKIKGKGWLVASITGIFWDVFAKMSDAKYEKLERLANREVTLFSCAKNFKYNPDLIPLGNVVEHLFKIAKPISEDHLESGKNLYKAFIYLDQANEKFFEACESDIGGSPKRKLKNPPGITPSTYSSEGIYNDIENIFWDFASNFDDCPNPRCKKLTDERKLSTEGCMHCGLGYCPSCSELTNFGKPNCSHCDEELP